MSAKVFVYIAHKDGQADDSALELLAAAGILFPGSAPVALVAGAGAEVAAVAKDMAAAFGEVWAFDQVSLAYPNAELLRPLLVKALPPQAVVLLPHSTLGMDLGPGLSVKLGAAYVPDVVDAGAGEGTTLHLIRQEYSGQVSTHVQVDSAQGLVLTLRGGTHRPGTPSASGQIVDQSAHAVGLTARRKFLEVVAAEASDIDITREEVLVSVGRGIGEQENLSLVEDLAKAMGAAVSCSRPLVDAKWLEKARQVGTSGQTVKPKVYLALGISGSFQHLGGIKGNPFLVAINKNPKAPIFQVASVGIVGDLLELLPILTEKIKKTK